MWLLVTSLSWTALNAIEPRTRQFRMESRDTAFATIAYPPFGIGPVDSTKCPPQSITTSLTFDTMRHPLGTDERSAPRVYVPGAEMVRH